MLSTKESETAPGVEILDYESPQSPLTQNAAPTISSNKRFLTALSFPGESRKFVAQVAYCLEIEIGRERTLYDKFFEAEFARPNLDTYLQNLYHNESELVVVFLGRDYERKEWPGLEWRAVRDLLKKRKDSSVMPIRLDDGDVTGSFSIDGYIDAAGRGPDEIARLILDRLRILTVGRSSHQAAPAESRRRPQRLAYIGTWITWIKKNPKLTAFALCLALTLVGGGLKMRQHQNKTETLASAQNQSSAEQPAQKPGTPPNPSPPAGGEPVQPAPASEAMILAGGNLPGGLVGAPYRYSQHLPVGAPGRLSLHWSTVGRFIPGLRLDPRSGSIAGVPRAAGDYKFSLSMRDGKGHVTAADFSLTIRQPLNLVVETPPPEGTVGAPYTQNFTPVGGTGKYSFSIDRGAVPGLQIDRESGKLSGVPTAPGRFSLTIRTADSAEETRSVTVEITIRPPVAISPVAPLPDATAGRPISEVTLIASGGTAPYRWSARSDLAPGLRLGASGILSGAPADAGTYKLSIQVEDAGGNAATVTLPLIVRAATLRLVTSRYQVRLGQPFSEEIKVADVPAATITVSNPPRFFTFDAITHRLKGTPSAIGTYEFLVTAMASPTATFDLGMRVEVPLKVFVEKPFGLEPELSLFRLIADTCLSHLPFVVVASRDDADAVLTCPQCSAANGRIPIQLNGAFDLPTRGHGTVPRRSLWTYSFIKAGLTDDMKSTEACTGGLGLQNSVESINRSLKGDK